MSNQELEKPSESLAFCHPKQDALLGYILTNDKFFAQVRSRIKPEWFYDKYNSKVFAAKVAFYDKWKRCPTIPELLEVEQFAKEDPRERNKIKNAVMIAQNQTAAYGLDVLIDELTTWYKSRVYQNGVYESAKLYNAKKITSAYKIFEESAREIKEGSFEPETAEEFENYYESFTQDKLELSNALTFGIDIFDQLLTPEAEKGSLLRGDTTILLAPTNTGKCLKSGTKIITYTGEVKTVEQIVKGELLMGPDGKPRRVLNTTKGRGPLFKIIPKNGGEPWVCNDVHVLSIKHGYDNLVSDQERERPRNRLSIKKKEEIINVPLNEFLSKSQDYQRSARLWRADLDFSEKDLQVDPYIFGLWLGDGHSGSAALTTMDAEIRDAWCSWIQNIGARLAVYEKPNNKARIYAALGNPNKGNAIFRSLGVLNNKHIPREYLTSSRKQRLALLAGLLDTDGYYCHKNRLFEITQKNKRLADDIIYLARSLGFKTNSCEVKKSCQTGVVGTYQRISICGALSKIPTRLERKRAKDGEKNPTLTGFTVEPVGIGDYYGFTLDGDHLFLLGDFTVTHNTTCLITVAMWNILQGKNVLFLTHEGRPEDIKKKIWMSVMNVSYEQLLSMYHDDKPRADGRPNGQAIMNNALWWIKKHLTYVPLNKAGLTIEDVGPVIRRHQEKRMAENNGVGYDMLIDDYPAKLTTELAGPTRMQRRQIDDYIYNYYVQFALEYKFHSLCVIQTNREGSRVNNREHGEDRLLQMEDVNESYGVMQSATNVVTLNRDARAKAAGRLAFHICKSRGSETGWTVVCRSNYKHAITHGNADKTHPTLGGTAYLGSSSMPDKIDQLLDNYSGRGVTQGVVQADSLQS